MWKLSNIFLNNPSFKREIKKSSDKNNGNITDFVVEESIQP